MNVYAVRYPNLEKGCVVTQFVKADDAETAKQIVSKEDTTVFQVFHDDGQPLLASECTIGINPVRGRQ